MAVSIGVLLGTLLQQQRHWLNDFHDVSAVAASLALQMEKTRMGACALNNYASALRHRGELDRAHEILEQAVRVNEDLGDVVGASTSRRNMANLLQEQGRLDEAIKLYRDDLMVCRESNHPYHAAGTMTNLGAALVRAGRPGEGVTQLKAALVIRRKLKDPAGLANSLSILGGALQELGHRQGGVIHARSRGSARGIIQDLSATGQRSRTSQGGQQPGMRAMQPSAVRAGDGEPQGPSSTSRTRARTGKRRGHGRSCQMPKRRWALSNSDGFRIDEGRGHHLRKARGRSPVASG